MARLRRWSPIFWRRFDLPMWFLIRLQSPSGAVLLDETRESILRTRLLRLAGVVSPNVEENPIFQVLTSGKFYPNGRLMAAKLPALALSLHRSGCTLL